MDVLLDSLIAVAGVALVGHIALCALLQWRFRDRAEILDDVFAVPNRRFSNGLSFRLLRARYYAPWVAISKHVQLDKTSRPLLLAARITGIVMPVASLAFLFGSAFQAVD